MADSINDLKRSYYGAEGMETLADAEYRYFSGAGTADVKAARTTTLYTPSATSLLRWKVIYGETLAGKRQAHIGVLGNSIAFGAAATGATPPKWLNCWPGQMRTRLAGRFGSAGGGFTLANGDLLANPTWDPRWTLHGNIINQNFGPFGYSCFRADGSDGATYIEFTDTCSEFWVYTIASGSTFTAQIDGGTIYTLQNQSAPTTSDIAPETGYYGQGVTPTLAATHNVYKVPAGSVGNHTIKLTPSLNASFDLFLTAIEGKIPTDGTFRVGNMSINGKKLSGFLAGSDSTNGIIFLDEFRADLLVLALGVNDWQGQESISDITGYLNTIIDRQRSTTTDPATGSTPPGGDIVLLWNPKPDVDTLGDGGYTNPTWDQVRDAYYRVAEDKDVAFIDLGGAWGGSYASGNALGMFADIIHPTDSGASVIAGLVENNLIS